MNAKFLGAGLSLSGIALFALVLLAVSCSLEPPARMAGGGIAPGEEIPVAEGKVAVTFTFKPQGTPGAVYLAGSFNDWNSSKDRMSDTDGDGIYAVTLVLAPGSYQYKFVADGQWMEDPNAGASADDGYGGKNSALEVSADENRITVGVGKGAAKDSPPLKKAPEKAAEGGPVKVTFLYDAGAGASAEVYLAGSMNEWDQSADPMTDEDGDGIYAVTKQLAPGRYEYKFLHDGQWLTDESAEEFSDDGFGGKNSILHVGSGAAETGLVVGMFEKLPEELGAAGEIVGRAGGKEKLLKEVVFRFEPVISGIQNVFLAGTFNDWNDSKRRMTDDDGDGVYEATLLLPIGKYEYKFVVDGKWMTDETASEFNDDGFGGKNSVLQVDESFKEVKFESGDGEMMYGDIPITLDYSMVNPLAGTTIEFKTLAHTGDVESVGLVYSAGGGPERSVAMKSVETDAAFQYYSVIVEEPADVPIRFTFRYTDGGRDFYASPGGIGPQRPDVSGMFEYTPEKLPPFFTPDWAKDGVFYQIFPERFRNGDPSNDPGFSEPYYAGVTDLPSTGKTNGEYFHLVRNWGDVSGLTRSPYRTDGRPDYYSFYGGDIAGVMEKLPYLADLGVTILYFNPLNEARSNHKYDPVDYMTIDPHFADEATFKEFVRKAHETGIRIIVDKAFNHTGNWHFAFLDSKEKGRESKYWDWYEWKRWPLPEGDVTNPLDYYDCWWGFGIHPNLNYDLAKPNNQENNITDIAMARPNEDLVRYILDVARYWLGDLGIDGFRLDVPNEVPFWFWKEFRRVVDEVNPDAFLIGEIWGNAMPWLGPRGFHSTMNYKYFREPVLRFFALGQGSAAQLDGDLAPGRSLYPKQATQVMMNLVGSHDTERFLTVAGNKEARLMLAALFQMTYVGIPQIYYGDEVGMAGGKDPDNRRPFTWGWEQNQRQSRIHAFYRKVIGIRRAYPALRTGTFTAVLTEGKVYAYLREDDTNSIAVVINNEGAPRSVALPLGGFGFGDGVRLVDELGGDEYVVQDGAVTVEMQPMTGAILVRR